MPLSSDVRLTCDRTGFPFLLLGNASVSLLPVTWVQLERRLSDPGGLSTIWYQSLFDSAPAIRKRVSWRSFRDEQREDLFVSGVKSEEAIDYVRWLKGSPHAEVYKFDLPQAELWRDAAAWMQSRPFDEDSIRLIGECGLCAAASTLIDRLISQIRPTTWADLALFKQGLFEWVRDKRGMFGGLGAPRMARLRHTFNPFNRQADPVRPLDSGRPYLFGLRPIVLCDELI